MVTVEHCGLVIDLEHNAALNLAALVAGTTGTATASGPDRAKDRPAHRGEERSQAMARCSSVYRGDGSGAG